MAAFEHPLLPASPSKPLSVVRLTAILSVGQQSPADLTPHNNWCSSDFGSQDPFMERYAWPFGFNRCSVTSRGMIWFQTKSRLFLKSRVEASRLCDRREPYSQLFNESDRVKQPMPIGSGYIFTADSNFETMYHRGVCATLPHTFPHPPSSRSPRYFDHGAVTLYVMTLQAVP